jgi:putative NADH-flavin reductase
MFVMEIALMGASGFVGSAHEDQVRGTKSIIAAIRKAGVKTMDALDRLRNEPELDWPFLAPAAELTPGGRTAKYRLGSDELLIDDAGKSRISVQDYAVAMIDELEHPAHVRQRFTVSRIER